MTIGGYIVVFLGKMGERAKNNKYTLSCCCSLFLNELG